MNHFKHTQLKKLSGAALGALALMSAMPAMAAVIDFESIGPATYNGTETFSESGYTMTVLDTPASADGTDSPAPSATAATRTCAPLPPARSATAAITTSASTMAA